MDEEIKIIMLLYLNLIEIISILILENYAKDPFRVFYAGISRPDFYFAFVPVFPLAVPVVVISIQSFIQPRVVSFIVAQDTIEPVMADLVCNGIVQQLFIIHR